MPSPDKRLSILVAAAALAACNRSAGVEIVDVQTSRFPDGAILADVEVAGYEQSGRDVGQYCVSVHFNGQGFVGGLTDPQSTYGGELEMQEVCPPASEPLSDGDHRTFRFVSKKKDIPSNLNIRAQSRLGTKYDYEDVPTP